MRRVALTLGPVRRRVGVLLLALALAAVLPGTAAAGNPNPGVLPPSANVAGVPLGDWFGRWLNWIVSVPDPIADCDANQGGQVFFIPHTFPGSTVETSCTIPAGRLIFASAGGVVCSEAFDGFTTAAELRACVEGALPAFSDLRITVDGRDVEDLGRYLAISGPFEWTIPDVTTTLAVAGGWQVILAPLTPGQHTIVVHDNVAGDVAQVTAHVTIAAR